MPFVNSQGGRLYYEVHDLTPPWVRNPSAIVFHHGVAADLHLWTEWLPYFIEYHRLVVFDMRGSGRSTVPGHGFPWSFEQLAGDALEVAQAAGAGRFHFVGESLGGTVGLFLASRFGDRLLSLTMANCAARGGLIPNLAGWRAMIETQGQQAWADRMMAWRFYPNALPQEKFEWLRELHARCPARVALILADLLAAVDLTGELQRVRAPTLLLCPDASPFVPVSHMAEMQAMIPDAELQVFAHARHGLPFSHAGACAKAVKAFLARRFPGSRAELPVII